MSSTVETYCWQGRTFSVDVLYSRAGVATNTLVRTADTTLLVDCGDGCLRDLLTADIRLETIDAVFFTHGHFDHMGGLHSILGFMRMIGRPRPLPIYAPEMCTEAFAAVHNFRRCYPDSIPFEIPLGELHPREILEIGSIRIESFLLVHAGSTFDGAILERIPAMGYRFSSGDESVAISGDTGLCDELKNLVRDTDFAVIESTFNEHHDVPDAVLSQVHLSEKLAREVGSLARDFVLVHGAKR